MIFYEAPHKLKAAIEDFSEFFGTDRRIVICRELTKLHEEVLRMTLGEAVEYYSRTEPKGEFVLLIEGKSANQGEKFTMEQAMEQVRSLIENGEKPTEACKAVAKETGFRKGELYSALQ